MRSVRVVLAAALLAVGLQMQAQAPVQAAPTATFTADFSVDKGLAHAEVFGSSINWLPDPKDIESLDQAGTRLIRGDAYLAEILPRTTIAAYKAAVGNGSPAGSVADPNTWDWSRYGWVDEHHQRGEKIMLIMSYSVDWLGYLPGRSSSPPKGADGWTVYEDAIAKIYQHFRGKVQLVEIWNEPDLDNFLTLDGSPYGESQRMEAYRDIYAHARAAIRSVDASIPIGGPVVSNPDRTLAWLNYLLASTVKDQFDFLSYHTYNDYVGYRDEMVETIRQRAVSLGRPASIPIYVTEWNDSPSGTATDLNSWNANAISYDALRLTKFINQRAAGANVYADNAGCREGVPEGTDCSNVYLGVQANGVLVPRARVYKMMSQELGLGTGDSRIRQIVGSPSSLIDTGAATNADGDNVAWVVNDGTEPLEVDLQLTGLGATAPTVANVFEASPTQGATSPKAVIPLPANGGSPHVNFAVPAKSVTGVRQTKEPYSDGDNLAATATVTASTVSARDPQLDAAKVKDGIVGVHAVGEWASREELTPNITLTWPTPQVVGRVVLSDRANLTDRVLAGKLVFSDGTTVPVPELPNTGLGKAITFAPRATTSVQFVVTKGEGLNVGLSEIQVHDGANVVREGTVTTSSQLDLGPHGQLKAFDGTPAEWNSTETNPSIRVDWANSHTIDRVVLADRVSTTSNVTSGTLLFSDGTSVPVSAVPADGTPKVASFPAKVVTWAKFQATGGSGSNVGLRELRVLSAPNVASSAKAEVSTVFGNDPAFGGSAATDGVANQWYAGEWGSGGQTSPWLKLSWPEQPQTIGQVVVYDRVNTKDHAAGGTLTFSDGSTVAVSAVDIDGTGRVIAFPPRATTSITFQINGSGLNVGLAEIQAFAVNGVQRIESVDASGKYWRHRNSIGRIDTPGEPAGSPPADFDFRVVAGLADRDGVSFESVNYPGHYLRHQNSVLQLSLSDGTPLLRADATFHPVPGANGAVSYRSHNYPDQFVHHTPDGTLKIAPGNDSTSAFRPR
ncbi:AbfB domain-containing protein [Kribbella sp. NPDC058245]|uniref:DUF7402 domain-containing protein n=1 Tax=Kribbella sp. NPDC058245 TaxID=3346399 RepID=UPI0036EBF108